MPNIEYRLNQSRWIIANRINTGDRVRIIRTAEEGENSWENEWAEDMNDYVDEVFYITDTSFTGEGILIDSFYFPYFVLEKVPHTITIDGETVDISDREYRLIHDLYLG